MAGPGGWSTIARLAGVAWAAGLMACCEPDSESNASVERAAGAGAAPASADTAPSLGDAVRQAAEEFAATLPVPDVADLRYGYHMPNQCSVSYPWDITPADVDLSAAVPAEADPAGQAIDAAILRRDLRILGYPGPVVEAALAELSHDPGRAEAESAMRAPDPDWASYRDEMGEPQTYSGSGRDRFLLRLWRYRRDHRPDLVLVRPGGDCGAGEFPVRFDIQPEGGRAFFITAFYLRACRLRDPDPYDRRRCPWWREVMEGRPVWMSGRYVYSAEWPDGRRRRGELPIDPFYEGDDEAGPPPIVLRAPG